jgi:hypothetical protein
MQEDHDDDPGREQIASQRGARGLGRSSPPRGMPRAPAANCRCPRTVLPARPPDPLTWRQTSAASAHRPRPLRWCGEHQPHDRPAPVRQPCQRREAANDRSLSDRIVWIDCEMTGLSLQADALIEVAALVTDYELNQCWVRASTWSSRPPAEALAQMDPFVVDMHTTSGLLTELAPASPWREAKERVLAYIKRVGARAPQGGPGRQLRRHRPHLHQPGTCPSSRPGCTTGSSMSRRSRSCRAAGIPGPTSTRRSNRGAPGPGRHPGVDRRTALLPRSRFRRPARSRLGDGTRPRANAMSCVHPAGQHHEHRGPGTIGGCAWLPSRAMVGVAQLVEHLVVVQDVAGSSPVTHPR